MAVQFTKTKMCKFEALGVCTKGVQCPFAHSGVELNPLPDLRRTKICKALIRSGVCDIPGCTYAHSKEELRTIAASTTAFKTKPCRFFLENGHCAIGSKCNFAHFPDELRERKAAPELEPQQQRQRQQQPREKQQQQPRRARQELPQAAPLQPGQLEWPMPYNLGLVGPPGLGENVNTLQITKEPKDDLILKSPCYAPMNFESPAGPLSWDSLLLPAADDKAFWSNTEVPTPTLLGQVVMDQKDRFAGYGEKLDMGLLAFPVDMPAIIRTSCA